MTFPIDISIGTHTISSHMVFEFLAFFLGFRYFLFLRKRQADTIDDQNRMIILIAAIFGALVFSRLLGALEKPIDWYHSDNPWMYLYGNKTIVGALLGGLICVEFTKKLLGVSQSSGDLMTFPLIFAIIVGRIGCFTMGVYEETYGEPTHLFLGMNLGDGLYRHPVSLYEIGFMVLVWVLLVFLEKKGPLKDGIRFQIFLSLYVLFRFLLDFIKPGFTYFWEIGSIQIGCFLALIYYRKTLVHLFLNPQKLYLHDTK